MISLYIVNDIYSGGIYSWVKFHYHPLCTQLYSSFKVKLGNTILEMIFIKDLERCHTDAAQLGMSVGGEIQPLRQAMYTS